jgi:hypothetical protein
MKITGPRTRFRSGQGREPYGRDMGREMHRSADAISSHLMDEARVESFVTVEFMRWDWLPQESMKDLPTDSG